MKFSNTLKIFEIGQGSRPYGATLYQKWKFLIFLGPHSHSPVAIEVKFCTAKRTHVSVGPAKFHVNRCNESPLWGEKPDFWPVSKFNTGSLPLCGILPVTRKLTIIIFVCQACIRHWLSSYYCYRLVMDARSAMRPCYLFIEYATSAGHHKNMYTHRNEKKRHKTLWKKAYTHKNTIKSKA